MKGIAVIFWSILAVLLLDWMAHAAGLKYVQGVVWPTDLYAFQRLELEALDVAVLGSSHASFGLSPSALDNCLSKELERETETVNLGRTFTTAWTADLMARDLLVGSKKPKVLVLGVGPEFFDEGNHRLHLGFAAEADILDIPEALPRVHGITGVLGALRPLVRGPESIALYLSGRYNREPQLRWMMIHHGGGQFCFGGEACDVNNGSVHEVLRDRWTVAQTTLLPRLAAERFPRSRIGGGPVEAHMDALLAWCAENGITPLVVQMPLHDAFLKQVPPALLDAYEAKLDALAADGVAVHRFAWEEWAHNRHSFIDPDHLGSQGSLRFSQQVCSESLLPLLQ